MNSFTMPIWALQSVLLATLSVSINDGGAMQGSGQREVLTFEQASISARVAMPKSTPSAIDRTTTEIARTEGQLVRPISSLNANLGASWMSGFFVLLGALIATGAGYLTHRAKIKADDLLSRRASGRQAIADIMDFRSRQLNEFYSPIRSLQGQGLAIRNQLYNQLIANPLPDYNFYYKREELAATGDSLWYTHGAIDKPFRLIDELKLLNDELPQLMPLVDEIIKSGEATAKLIIEHSGLALPENEKLTEMLGDFLAHHAIIKQIRGSVTSPTLIVYTATYPRGFDKVIKDDYDELVKELRAWKDLADELAS